MINEILPSSRVDQALNRRRQQSKIQFTPADIYTEIMDRYKIEKSEVNQIIALFQKYENPTTKIITFNDLIVILKKLYYDVNQKIKEFIFKEFETRGIKKITVESTIILIGQLKQFLKQQDQENSKYIYSEYEDVFVALGGNADKTGFVPKSKILDIIKDEFELTYDMEVFLEKIEGGKENLDFHTFCLLFEQRDENGIQRTNSVLSLLSQKSVKSLQSTKSLKISYNEFQKYYQQMENKGNYTKHNIDQ